MKSACLLLAGAFLLVSFSAARAQYFPQHKWSHGFGDIGMDAAYGVVVDINNRAIVIGCFEGTINLGGGPLVSAGSTDVFVGCFDMAGNHVWSRRFGGAGADVAHGIVSEDFYTPPSTFTHRYTVTGTFEATVNFGGSDLVSSGGSDGFVVRIDGNGNHLWSARFGDAGDDAGRSISLLADHGVSITGSVTDPQLGTTDVFIGRFDAAGAQVWAHTWGGPLDDVGWSISAGASGMFITGEFRDQASFGGSPLVSAGGSDIFVARYDGTGSHVWSRPFGGTQDDAGLSVGPYFTGYFRGTVNFGGSDLTSAGGEDIFLLRLDANGVHQDSRRYGGTGDDAGTGLEYGNGFSGIDLIGRFENSVNFGSATLTSAGGSDGFIAMFKDDGTNLRDIRLGGTGDDVINDVTPYAVGFIPEYPGYFLAFAGKFMNTMDLGGGPLVSAGGDDAFVVSYSEAFPSAVGPGRVDQLSIGSYPNPFNPTTTVTYTVPSVGPVTVSIYDVRGAHIATLVNNPHHPAGAFEVRWEGRGDAGATVASGVYFAQLEQNAMKRVTRMVMLK